MALRLAKVLVFDHTATLTLTLASVEHFHVLLYKFGGLNERVHCILLAPYLGHLFLPVCAPI